MMWKWSSSENQYPRHRQATHPSQQLPTRLSNICNEHPKYFKLKNLSRWIQRVPFGSFFLACRVNFAPNLVPSAESADKKRELQRVEALKIIAGNQSVPQATLVSLAESVGETTVQFMKESKRATPVCRLVKLWYSTVALSKPISDVLFSLDLISIHCHRELSQLRPKAKTMSLLKSLLYWTYSKQFSSELLNGGSLQSRGTRRTLGLRTILRRWRHDAHFYRRHSYSTRCCQH
ncbi:hypothetical protein DFJ73DRAFT_139785 [Zopfochytrium polystomum]|nr:hypothetical protein DFJ73DRAFT_139785 [Zopfochytrium polystomum]